MLPPFTLDGVLPPGDYKLTFSELKASLLVLGPTEPPHPNWDANWRHHLVCNAEILAQQLWAEGIDEIFLDGSFLEAKARPNDIDGYFTCDAGALLDLRRRLNLRDPQQVWTWDVRTRRLDPDSGKHQLPMWHAYRVELYPHFGQFSGILGPTGYPLTFPDAFRRRRGDSLQKGIVRIVR